MNLLIHNSSKYMSIRSRFVSQQNNKLISNSEQLFNASDLLPITFGIILPPNQHGEISTNFHINPGTIDENKNSKVRTIDILLDSGASASFARKDVIKERHRILKQK